MISTLSSFASQFDPALIESAHKLFKSGAVQSLEKDQFTWNTEVSGPKNYKVSVRVEDGSVTDVFCMCRSGVCIHTMAVMFALKKKLRIKTEVFKPEMLDPNPIYLVGPRLNDLIYTSRQAGSKNGELEELGESISLNNLEYSTMRRIVCKGLTGYDNSPIFTGAKKLLGAAILAIEEENYPPVFTVARAVLTEICTLKMMSNSASECCEAAAALLEELYNLPNPSSKLKDEIFTRVLAAWDMKLYADYQQYLIPVITLTLQKKSQQQQALKKLNELDSSFIARRAVGDAQVRLLEMLGKPDEAKQVRYNKLDIYRKDLVEEAFERKDYEEVKKLAREVAHGYYQKDWWDWIYKIAQIEGDTQALRDYYRYQYYHAGFSNSDYNALRATYDPKEWIPISRDMAEKFEQNRSISKAEISALAHIYFTEGADDKLAMHLKRFPRFDLARKAQPLIETKYPDLVKKIMHEHFIDLASASFTRDRTLHLYREMKNCCETTEATKRMNALRIHLLKLHPTWKIFTEIMSKRM